MNREDIKHDAWKYAYGYFDNELLKEKDVLIKKSIDFGINSAIEKILDRIQELGKERFEDEDGVEVKYWHFDDSDLEKMKGELLPYKGGRE